MEQEFFVYARIFYAGIIGIKIYSDDPNIYLNTRRRVVQFPTPFQVSFSAASWHIMQLV